MQDKFETKYPFVENEKEVLSFWKENDCFQKLKAKNAGGPKYRFIDGPITANNPMGIHHTWGRTLKDTFIKYNAMKGRDTHYRNGFDSQGLWVEVEVEKELGFKTKHDIEAYGLDKFTEKCIERVRSSRALSPSSLSDLVSGWTGITPITPTQMKIFRASGHSSRSATRAAGSVRSTSLCLGARVAEPRSPSMK